MSVPITQSKMWQNLQTDLGETSFFKCENDYQYLAILKSTPVGKYLYLPYGPVVASQLAFDRAIADLTNLAASHRAIFIRIEPQNPKLKLPKTARKSHDLNPKETWALDLTGNDEDLKARLPSRLVRYYNASAKKGITIETSHDPADIHYLLDLQKALAREKGISTFSERYLQTELAQPFATLYIVKQHPVADSADSADNADSTQAPITNSTPEILAAGLVFDDDSTRYNLQGAQSDQGRKLHATGILTIQLILDAKAKGLKSFDFWGIAPEGAPESHPWAGFTNFKKTFAGAEVDYLGTYDLVISPVKYHIYQIFRKLRRML